MWGFIKQFFLLAGLAFVCMTLTPIPILWHFTDHSISEILLTEFYNYKYLIISFTVVSALITGIGKEKVILLNRSAIGGGFVISAVVFIIVRTLLGSA